jgi:hypothetical protein
MSFTTLADAGGPSGCLADAATALTRQPGNQNVVPATDEGGEPVRGEDEEKRQEYAVYLLAREGTSYAVYLDCRTVIEGQTVLLITQLVEAGRFNDENEPRQELLDGLAMPSDVCAEIVAYVDATREVLNRYDGLYIGRLAILPSEQAFRAEAENSRVLLEAQEALAVPLGAEQAQDLLLAFLSLDLEMYEDLTDIYAELEQGNTNIPPLEGKFEAIPELRVEAEAELDDLDAQCGAGTDEPADEASNAVADQQAYACPPDQLMIDEWRANAEETRELAESMDDPLSAAPFLILADQWDQMADDWELACAHA